MRGEINWPIIYGIGVNIKTGEIFPAAFTDKGPDLQLRQARNFTGGQTVFLFLRLLSPIRNYLLTCCFFFQFYTGIRYL